MENVDFSLQLLNKYVICKYVRCTFINTSSCDKQHALYRNDFNLSE